MNKKQKRVVFAAIFILLAFVSVCANFAYAQPNKSIAIITVGNKYDKAMLQKEKELAKKIKEKFKEIYYPVMDIPVLNYYMDVKGKSEAQIQAMGATGKDLLFAGVAIMEKDAVKEALYKISEVKNTAEVAEQIARYCALAQYSEADSSEPLAFITMCEKVTEEQKPVNFTRVFSQFAEHFYCVIISGDLRKSVKIKAVWLTDNVPGFDSSDIIDSVELDVPSYRYAMFSLKKGQSIWPVGTYKLELYIDKKLKEVVRFSVKK